MQRINITVPKGWHELSQKQLRYLFFLVSEGRDAHSLLRSPIALPVRTDGRFFEVGLSQAFLEYGLWQDYGTGREIPRGNSGDLGREKVRGRRRWFSRQYYASVMNIKEFFADNLGKQFTGIIADAFDDVNFRKEY